MTALAARRNTKHYFIADFHEPKQGTGGTIYEGGMAMVNAAGFTVPAADTASAQGVHGVSHATSTAPSANGGKTVRLNVGIFGFVVTGSFDATSAGKVAYVADDQTVQMAISTNGVKAGVIFDYESATACKLWIRQKPAGRGVTDADADGTYGAAEATLINNIKAMINTYLF